ncbi:DUF1853 family protein [Massilia timonae]|uniref:DUF1853 family protein n=1 Tax=Massilia timonae TaxID=47229 RepID=A0A1S2N7J9_9BURK|nr:DUF1853 family protein [Massilia timonae]OIJ40790.1 hypothetical protein LO55_4668 [Massilia timonae]
MDHATSTYQATFHRRWGHLRRAPVRALAWLLDSPDLLDVAAPEWLGRIATLGPVTPGVADWLAQLDRDPSRLEAALGDKTYTRLGLYAEKLMAFYFAEQGRLVRHGLQVRAARNDTVGEFDFLLERGPDALTHIEFATKFYLLDGGASNEFDALVGPNLADSLGRKMRKVFERQLALGDHPAAQALLPLPVTQAQALIKGWLFYPSGSWPAMQGITAGHCRGFWCALEELDAIPGEEFLILPKLEWLAPYLAQAPARSSDRLLTRPQLGATLAQAFDTSSAPVLVAILRRQGDLIEEAERGFIVPNDWRTRAAQVRLLKSLHPSP